MKVIELTYKQMREVKDQDMPQLYKATSREDGLEYLYDKDNAWLDTTGKFRAFKELAWGEIKGLIENQQDLVDYIAAHGGGYDDTEIRQQISDLEITKQNTLTAGNNITIVNDVISAASGSSVTKLSELENDTGFITDSYHDDTKQDILIAGNNIEILADGTINCTASEGGNELVYYWEDTDNPSASMYMGKSDGSFANVDIYQSAMDDSFGADLSAELWDPDTSTWKTAGVYAETSTPSLTMMAESGPQSARIQIDDYGIYLEDYDYMVGVPRITEGYLRDLKITLHTDQGDREYRILEMEETR